MIGIYKITSPTGCVYIGQSVNINKRFRNYKILCTVKSQRRLYESFLLHGVLNHVFEIIQECERKQLNELERYYQDLYDCIGKNGLNIRLTTSKTKPGYYSEESRTKMSINRTGEKNHMFGKFGDKHPSFGSKTSDDTKNLFKLQRTGKIKSEQHKINIGIPQIGGLNHQAKCVIDLSTGIFYDCIKDAARAKNIKHSTLCDYLKNRRGIKNKTTLRFA